MNIKFKIMLCILVFGLAMFSSCGEDAVTEEVALTDISLSDSSLLLDIEEVQPVIVSAVPNNATEKVVWTSNDESIAQIQYSENGLVLGVKGISLGTTIVTAEVGNITKDILVEVIQKVESIKLDIQGGVPETNISNITFEVVFTPEDATYQNVTWESSNPEIATVVNGMVTALSPGIASITATTEQGGKVASADVTVAGDPAVLWFQYCEVTPIDPFTYSYNVEEIITTGAIMNIDYSGGIPPDNYEFISGHELTVAQESTFNIAIKNLNGWSRSAAWIDWNGDLDFTDEGEFLGAFSPEKFYSGDPGESYNKDIIVPGSAVVGASRVRVLSGDAWYFNDGDDPVNGPGMPDNPCGAFKVGIYKDFIINIQ